MKLLKKLAVAAIAAAMVMGLSIPAFADETQGEDGGNTPATHSITVKNSKENHTYQAYQIFSGDLYDGKLSNIQWGASVTDEGKEALGDAEVVAAGLTDGHAFAKQIAPYLIDSPVAETSDYNGGNYVLNLSEAGYYLVKDKDETLENHKGTAYTEYIVRVAGKAEVTAKSSAPQVTKKTKDCFDENNLQTGWQDSGDYDIGDLVPFKLEANLADNVADFENYTVIFHDTLSKGLEFYDEPKDKALKVLIDSEENTTAFTYSATKAEDGTTALTITFNNLQTLGSPKEIVIEYSAVLTKDAVMGAGGNPNTVYLEYSNNPYGNTTGKTVEDKVVIFTYQLKVDKLDGNSKPLAGAGFTLYKIGPNNEETKIGEELSGAEMTTFVWNGIDDGKYKLVETTTPQGYNTIDDIVFHVHAEHDLEAANPQLTNLHTSNDFTADRTAGTLTGKVINQAGAILPSTGGMGTTILYAVGIILVLGAGIALVVRKRARND